MSTCARKFCFVFVLVILVGFLGFDEASAQTEIGVYWDTEFTDNSIGTTAANEWVTGYLVILPKDWVAGGVLAWECEMEVTGPGLITSWDLEGAEVNVLTPPRFSVGLGTPLPFVEYVKIATFEMVVTEPELVEVSLKPIYFASIPGEMGYIDADEPDVVRIMTPVTGESIVATINAYNGTWCGTDWQHVLYFGNVIIGESLTRTFGIESCGGERLLDIKLGCDDPTLELTGISGVVIVPNNGVVHIEVTYTPTDPVGISCVLDLGPGLVFPIYGFGEEPVGLATPTPVAIQQGGQVELEWPARAPAGDQYHVYRKDPQGHEVRLTETPLAVTATTVRFSDRPDYPAGTVLRYSYSVLHDGFEWDRSAEVEITVEGLPRFSSQLLRNVPNPFNPQTEIRFELSRSQDVRVQVFDVTGRLVKTLLNEARSLGENSVVWQGRDDTGRRVSSGAYYVRLETIDGVDQQKIMMLK